jgi:hypothetical protein
MSLARAGGLTTLFLTALVTAGLIMAEEWYAAITTGDMIKRLLVVGPLALIAITPVTFVLFPLVHAALSRGAGIRPSGKLFALLGGVCGTIIAGWVLFRFRNALASTPSIMLTVMTVFVIGATTTGVLGGFLFEWMARRAPQTPEAGAPPPKA